MKKALRILASTLLILNPLVSANADVACDALTAPITSVADFDSSGAVNGKDIAMLSKNIGKKNTYYSALLDRNADGELDNIDVFLATRDMGKTSTQTDQNLATAYNGILAGTDTCYETVLIEEPTNVDLGGFFGGW